MSEKCDFLIVGAGPTGLGAAYRLRELGINNFVVLESKTHPGGLSASYLDENKFTWDVGGHVQFSHYEYFDQVMSEVLPSPEWNVIDRDTTVHMNNRQIRYPLQNNLHELPFNISLECVLGLLKAKFTRSSNPANFKEWMFQNFGNGITKKFLIPYNFKVWAYEPHNMIHYWNRERVAVPTVKDLALVLLRLKTDAWGPNKTFRFPKKGGTGSIWKAVAAAVDNKNIQYNSALTHLDIYKKIVITSDGKEIAFNQLLSTIPIPHLMSACSTQVSPEVKHSVSKLKHSSSNIIGLGLRGKPPTHIASRSWMYFPEDTTPFYRATVFSNYSEHHTPDNTQFWSLMTETSESPQKKVNPESLIQATLAGAIKTGLIDGSNELASTWQFKADFGYPTPYLGRDEALSVILPSLESKDIFSRGRFGGWKYEVSNQDHSFMQGVEWSNKVVSGVPETTLFYPDTINTGTPRA